MTDPTSLPTALPTALPADENQIIAERRAKLARLREAGCPFPNDFQRTDHAGDLHQKYGALDRDALAEKGIEVAVAGRLMLKRLMGKTSFATVQDSSGRIQFFITDEDTSAAARDAFKSWIWATSSRRAVSCSRPTRASCRYAARNCGC